MSMSMESGRDAGPHRELPNGLWAHDSHKNVSSNAVAGKTSGFLGSDGSVKQDKSEMGELPRVEAHEQQEQFLITVLQEGLNLQDVWLTYLVAGHGTASQEDLALYAVGALMLPAMDRHLLDQAVDDLLDDATPGVDSRMCNE